MGTFTSFMLAIFAFIVVAEARYSESQGCWVESKKCWYEEVQDGWECKDYYVDKYARCHPKMKTKKKCDKPTSSRERPEKKGDYIIWEQEKSELVHYDDNYGPHVEGYPSEESSEYYFSKELPERPYGVDRDAYPAPTQTPAPAYTAPPEYIAPPKTSGETPPAYTEAPAAYTEPPSNTQAPQKPEYTEPPAHTAPPTRTEAPQQPAYTEPPAPVYTEPSATSATDPYAPASAPETGNTSY